MEKMSTTNNPFQKAEKLQDQISELSLQPRIEVLPANQTTLLSKKTQDTIEELKKLRVPHPLATKQSYPPIVRLRSTDLEEHPAFELTVEQLRAAWMLAYGTRWVSMEKPMDDDYLNVVAHRLLAFGEVETHNVIDQYTPMGRIKIQDASS
jgi:putative SOS response-associated peptidase YedK